MYSYFYDRPDQREPVGPEAESGLPGSGFACRAIASPAERRQRKSAWAVFVLFLALILLVSLSAVAVAIHNGRELQPLDEVLSELSEGPKTIGRAPVGDGTVMTLEAFPHGGELTPNEIYTKSVRSVVSIRGESRKGTSLGTGIILSEDGYIITNHHVIDGAEKATVARLDNGATYDALLVGSDAQTDLAVLKVEAHGLTPAEFGDSTELKVGDPAYAVGNPLGEQLMGTMTDGMISYVDRSMSVDGHEMELIQTTAALNSGNSGGALVNQYGQVVGVTTLKMSSDWNTIEGLGFAIPTAWAKEVVDELIESGHIGGRPTIGITVGPSRYFADDPESVPEGLWVSAVEEKSDAYAQGMRPGDIITAANGQPVRTIDELNAQKEGLGVGDTIVLTVVRGEEELTFTVALVEQYTLKE